VDGAGGARPRHRHGGAMLPGYDAILQAMVGLMSINGTETSGATRLGNPIDRPFLGNRDPYGAA